MKWDTAFLNHPEDPFRSLQIKSNQFFAGDSFVRVGSLFDQLRVSVGRSTNDDRVHTAGSQNLPTLIGRSRSRDRGGHLLRRFASRGVLNSPWGVTRASFAFGRFSGDILIGNFGDGRINAFDSDGNFLATLKDAKDKPLIIEGLWNLALGGGRNSSSDTLYFTAGPNDEKDGLFGTITPAAKNQ